MGWLYTRQSEKSLSEQKSDHAWNATRYGANVRAEILAQEWHAKTWFAVMRVTCLEGHEKAGNVETWLNIDLIDTAGGQFGYKSGSESMGMYQENKPSRAFAAEIYRHIPSAQGYGIEWRARNGVKHDDMAQGAMAL